MTPSFASARCPWPLACLWWVGPLVLLLGCGRAGYGADTGGDGGPADAATPTDAREGGADAGPEGGCVSPPCALALSCADRPDALLCDDFESGDAAAWDENVGVAFVPHPDRPGTVAYAETFGAGDRSLLIGSFAPVTGGSIHLRVFVFAPDDAAWGQINGFILEGDDDAYLSIVLTNSGVPGATYLYATAPLTGAGGTSSAPEGLDTGTWECLELAIQIADAPNGSATLSKNGTPFQGGNVVGGATLPPGGFHSLLAGLAYSSQTAPFSLYFDDLVVDDAPIGCD